jgi:hypothetical protein
MTKIHLELTEDQARWLQASLEDKERTLVIARTVTYPQHYKWRDKLEVDKDMARVEKTLAFTRRISDKLHAELVR